MLNPNECILFSGGASGTEAAFGALAEQYGIQEVNYSFEGHRIERQRGIRMLTTEELELKDFSLTYVSKIMRRSYSRGPLFRKVLQSIGWQVSSGQEIFIVGCIQPDDTVKGGTGWGAEFAKICNKPTFVFDQEKDAWFQWEKDQWNQVQEPLITKRHFTGTGTRFLEENGRRAIAALYERSIAP